MKRFISLLLVAVMLIGVLAGCAKEVKDTSKQDTPPEQVAKQKMNQRLQVTKLVL